MNNMKITICGSLKFIGEMNAVKHELEKAGHSVLVPLSAQLNQTKEHWQNVKNENPGRFFSIKSQRIKKHFDEIKSSDAVVVLNYDKDEKRSYIGPNTLMEIAIAFEHGKKIFILNRLSEDDPYYDEILSVSPLFLDGKLTDVV